MRYPAKTVVHAVAAATARFAATFALLVGILLALQAHRQRQATPLDAPELTALRQELAQNPGQAQAERIRQLDYLYRRAWFAGEAQLRFGASLLGGSLLLLLAALQLAQATAERQVERPDGKAGNGQPTNAQARQAILALGAAGALAVILWGWLGHGFPSALPKPPAVKPGPLANGSDANPATPGPDDTKPHIDVRSNPGPGTPGADDTKSHIAVRRTWTGFRGGDNLGLGDASLAPPQSWNGETGDNVRWRLPTELPGFSSPIAWEDRVFVTGGDKKARAVFCHAADDGRLLWRTDVPMGNPGAELPQVSDDTGYAAATPATDGIHVCAIFATGDLAGLDFSGKLLWSKSLGVPKNSYGHASSLLITGGKLLVQFDDDEKQSLAAYDPATGQLLWESKRQAAVGWASPVCVPAKAGPIVVVLTNETIEAFDLATGQPRWTTRDCLRGEVAPSAAFADGRIFVANDNACAAAIDPETGQVLWKNEEVDLPDVASPLATDGALYLFTSSSSQIVCLEAATGKKLWSAEMDEGFYSSPLRLGGQLLAFNRKGIAHRFKPSLQGFAETGGFPLGEAVMATPAAQDRRLYVRGTRHLFCLEEGTKTAPPPAAGGQP